MLHKGAFLPKSCFVIYENDIIEALNLLHFVLYADDRSVFSSSNDINTLVNTSNIKSTNICARFEANHLSLNSDLTSYLIFHWRKPVDQGNACIIINGSAIRRANDAKFLCVMNDEKLSFRFMQIIL